MKHSLRRACLWRFRRQVRLGVTMRAAMVAALTATSLAGCLGGSTGNQATASPASGSRGSTTLTVVGTYTTARAIPARYNGTYLVDGERETAITAHDRTGRPVAVHQVPAGKAVHDVLLSGHWLLVIEINDTRDWSPPELHRYDLQTGVHDRVDTRPVIPPMTWPEARIQGGTVYYVTTRGQRDCSVLLDIASLRATLGACARTGYVLGNPVMSADTITVSEFKTSDALPHCAALLRLDRRTAQQRSPVRGPSPCRAWSGATVGGVTLWSELTPDQEQQRALSVGYGFLSSSTVTRRSEGPVLVDTLQACGRYLVWMVTTLSPTDGWKHEVRRLAPGGKVEVLWASKGNAQRPSGPPYCSDDWMAFAVRDDDRQQQIDYAMRMS